MCVLLTGHGRRKGEGEFRHLHSAVDSGKVRIDEKRKYNLTIFLIIKIVLYCSSILNILGRWVELSFSGLDVSLSANTVVAPTTLENWLSLAHW